MGRYAGWRLFRQRAISTIPAAFLQARLRFRGLRARQKTVSTLSSKQSYYWPTQPRWKYLIKVRTSWPKRRLCCHSMQQTSYLISGSLVNTYDKNVLYWQIKSFFVLQTFWTPAIHAFVITLEHSYRALKSIFNGQWTWPSKPQLLKKWNSHSKCNFTPLFQYLITLWCLKKDTCLLFGILTPV